MRRSVSEECQVIEAVDKSATGAANVVRIWHRLGGRRRTQFFLLLGLVVVSAIAEVVSLGAVLPFLAVLTDPERLFEHPQVAHWAKRWGYVSADQLILPLTVAFAGAAMATGIIRITLLWASNRLAFATGADISAEMYRRTLYQPYSVHVYRNSSEVISGISHKTNAVIDVLTQVLMFISSLLILMAVTATLVFINPQIALIATFGFGTAYACIALVSRRRLHRLGERISGEQGRLIKALQEGLGGIRDVLLDGTQKIYSDIYRRADLRLRRAQGTTNFISQSPRFAMEAVGLMLISVLAYELTHHSGGVRAAIPTLGALALGAQRLLPVLQQLYSSWATIVGRQAQISGALSLLEQPLPADVDAPEPQPLAFQKELEFRNVSFRYRADAPWVLNGLNLVIPCGSRVGFVGSTGSGKSTTVDLLMGLLSADKGELLVDGQPLEGSRVRAWQRSIAHVPQAIFLADASLAENIAFCVPPDRIDMEKVRRAAAQAQIADFIESHPDGYRQNVGERGVRLSGGQRQRIGIARALYKEATVLVFDEATSALDNATEQSVMDAIAGLDRSLTVIQIAHRLPTLRHCDFIVELGEGKVISQGSYENLLDSSSSFRQMALAAG
jgi:ATP-binding cassette, subfamily B, bacterial PglK